MLKRFRTVKYKGENMSYKRDQERLDKKKYLESEKAGFDLSGHLEHCQVCPCRDDNCHCLASQDDRVKDSLCGRAYAKLCDKHMKEKKHVRKN